MTATADAFRISNTLFLQTNILCIPLNYLSFKSSFVKLKYYKPSFYVYITVLICKKQFND